MTNNLKIRLSLLLSFFLFTGCAAGGTAGEPPSYFGNAVRQNIAAQVINPDAPEDNVAPSHVGSRTAIAQQRYMVDKVEKPSATSTSSVQRSGGGE